MNDDIMLFPIDWLMSTFDIKLFVTKKVGELISGYDDTLMALAELNDNKFSLTGGVRTKKTIVQFFILTIFMRRLFQEKRNRMATLFNKDWLQ